MRQLIIICVFGVIACSSLQPAAVAQQLAYVPAAVDNPLKGLVPYSGDKRDNFPHSMEFNYLPLSNLMTGMTTFDWQPLEDLLNDVASRGHQTVFRVWMVYPGRADGIPKFLIEDGVKVTTWLNTNTAPFPPEIVHTPDYNDPRMRRALRNFIEALGRIYDGDPRVGFLTAGLLGTWGEWHEYPRQELFASKETQAEVMDSFTAAFKTTPVLLRYPSGSDHWLYASNAGRPFGYHDDSFAWATLDTGREADDWFLMPSLKAAGPEAMDKWKTQPIGGEIRPELWGRIFDRKVGIPKAQSFGKSVNATHATWLMDTGMMEKQQSAVRIANASQAVQKMGYEFHVRNAAITNTATMTSLRLQLRNTGVAPFYYDWKIVVAALDDGGLLLKEWPTEWKLTELLPDANRTWQMSLMTNEIPRNAARFAIRVINPLKDGLPLRFANVLERQQADGWFRVGAAKLPPLFPASGIVPVDCD